MICCSYHMSMFAVRVTIYETITQNEDVIIQKYNFAIIVTIVFDAFLVIGLIITFILDRKRALVLYKEHIKYYE